MRSMARRFRPLHALLVVAALMAATFAAQHLLASGRASAIRVGPDSAGTVRLAVGDLAPSNVRYYRFLNPGNQEVRFLVGRDPQGALLVAFDASENDFKRKRGFRHEGEWLVNNKCDTATRLSEVRAGKSGCGPAPLAFQEAGDEIVLTEDEILRGWRFFR
jgi:uncharacterized membrane protein